ncbi:hypothetical protein LguiA_031006 [Lonicera macranthoides]
MGQFPDKASTVLKIECWRREEQKRDEAMELADIASLFLDSILEGISISTTKMGKTGRWRLSYPVAGLIAPLHLHHHHHIHRNTTELSLGCHTVPFEFLG